MSTTPALSRAAGGRAARDPPTFTTVRMARPSPKRFSKEWIPATPLSLGCTITNHKGHRGSLAPNLGGDRHTPDATRSPRLRPIPAVADKRDIKDSVCAAQAQIAQHHMDSLDPRDLRPRGASPALGHDDDDPTNPAGRRPPLCLRRRDRRPLPCGLHPRCRRTVRAGRPGRHRRACGHAPRPSERVE